MTTMGLTHCNAGDSGVGAAIGKRLGIAAGQAFLTFWRIALRAQQGFYTP
jgi:hypothetical protein